MPSSSPSPDGAHVSARAPTSVYCGGREPAFLAALTFAAGIVAGNFAWRAPQVWLVAFLLAAAGVGFLYRRAPSLAFPLAILTLIPLGAFYLQLFDAARTTPPNLQAFATGEGTVEVTAHVMREGIVRDSSFGGKQESVDGETEDLAIGDRQRSAPIDIRLTIFSKRSDEEEAFSSGIESPLQVYTCGERLHIAAKLRAPRNYGNPAALDLVGYLSSQGVRLTGSARASEIEILPGFVGSRIGLWRSNARRSVLSHIQQLWPGEPGALMQAMLIGGKAFFGRDLKTNFQRTGTYHILVVSGINVGILAFAFFWALRWLAMGEAAATLTSGPKSCGTDWIRLRRNSPSLQRQRGRSNLPSSPAPQATNFNLGERGFVFSTRSRVPSPETVRKMTSRWCCTFSLARLQLCWFGDSHKRIEELMEGENPKADLLKIGHHGSLTASTPEFLQAVAPQFAVVSAGYYNSFHHPRPEVMQRFADRHVTTYRTDLAGAVSFYLDGTTVSAQPVPR